MGELIVVTGPPGAGKSTVSRTLSRQYERSAVVVGDAFFGFLDQGAVAPWLPSADRQNRVVIEAAAAAAGRLSRDYTVVYDGIIGPWFLPTFLAATGLSRLSYVVLLPTVDVCLERVATRSGHAFSDAAAARHMHTQFAEASIDARHVITDPGHGPDGAEQIVELIRRRVRLGAGPGSFSWSASAPQITHD